MKKIGDVEDGSDTPDPTPTPGTDDSKKDDNKQDDLNQGDRKNHQVMMAKQIMNPNTNPIQVV